MTCSVKTYRSLLLAHGVGVDVTHGLKDVCAALATHGTDDVRVAVRYGRFSWWATSYKFLRHMIVLPPDQALLSATREALLADHAPLRSTHEAAFEIGCAMGMSPEEIAQEHVVCASLGTVGNEDRIRCYCGLGAHSDECLIAFVGSLFGTGGACSGLMVSGRGGTDPRLTVSGWEREMSGEVVVRGARLAEAARAAFGIDSAPCDPVECSERFALHMKAASPLTP